MSIRFLRVAIWCAALMAAASALAQDPPPVPERRYTPEQWEQFRPLFTLVEDAAAGTPTKSDLTVAWQSHAMKAEANLDFAPFTVKPVGASFTSFPVNMYVRVVQRGAPAPVPGLRDALAHYPFEDVAIFDEPPDGRFARAVVVPPGQWDIYVAMRETATAQQPSPKTVVVKHEIDLPDFSTGLTVSSILVADAVGPYAEKRRFSFEEQLDKPYALWGSIITPSLDNRFSRSKKLSVLFLVYNAEVAANDKPSVRIEFSIFQKTGTTETFFGRTSAQLFDPNTLRPDFSATKGDLLIAGQDMPLQKFPDGDYRLEIKVTDNTNDKWLTRDVNFTVAGE